MTLVGRDKLHELPTPLPKSPAFYIPPSTIDLATTLFKVRPNFFVSLAATDPFNSL